MHNSRQTSAISNREYIVIIWDIRTLHLAFKSGLFYIISHKKPFWAISGVAFVIEKLISQVKTVLDIRTYWSKWKLVFFSQILNTTQLSIVNLKEPPQEISLLQALALHLNASGGLIAFWRSSETDRTSIDKIRYWSQICNLKRRLRRYNKIILRR